jgi:hypothetical protein
MKTAEVTGNEQKKISFTGIIYSAGYQMVSLLARFFAKYESVSQNLESQHYVQFY